MSKESAEINPAGIRLSKKSGIALYMQVYEQFRNLILKNQLRPGERLPASRNLAIELGVSRVIISQAYEQLLMEGYTVGKTGSGTFVAELLPDHLLHAGRTNKPGIQFHKIPPQSTVLEIASISSSGKSIIHPFQTGTPSLDMFPYKTWHRVGNKVLQELKGFHLGYEHTLGYWPLRKAIAAYVRISRAVNCEANQVIVVTGSQQGINLVAAGLLKKKDQVWMEDPGYPGARESFVNASCCICPVPVEKDGLDVGYAIKHYGNARMAYITPAHQFPLGNSLSEEKRKRMLEWAYQKNSWILEDDYDSEFRYEGRPLISLQGQDAQGRVIYSGTFSKVMFPGLRLAYLVLPSAVMAEELMAVKVNIDRQSPIMEQIMLSRFMEEGYFPRHIRKMRLLYAGRHQILIDLIKESLKGYLQPDSSSSGMQLLCRLSAKIDIGKFKAAIQSKGLVVAFINDYAVKFQHPPSVSLGFTAFTRYKLKMAVEKLREAVLDSLL